MKIPKINITAQEIHVITWLVKDIFWCLKLVWMATFMVFPTLVLTIYVLYNDKQNKEINYLISSWLLMNIFWMLHELQNFPFFLVFIFMISGLFFTFKLLKNRKSI